MGVILSPFFLHLSPHKTPTTITSTTSIHPTSFTFLSLPPLNHSPHTKPEFIFHAKGHWVLSLGCNFIEALLSSSIQLKVLYIASSKLAQSCKWPFFFLWDNFIFICWEWSVLLIFASTVSREKGFTGIFNW